MNQITPTPMGKQAVVMQMAERFGMDPEVFQKTILATCSPAKTQLTREQFAAFIVTANEYGLNPLTREIFAFPAQGGGIVPILSIDGWISLVNRNPQLDGFDFREEHDEKGNLRAVTCTMYRKDRNYPLPHTEYLAECKRNTEPWNKWPHRMLKHKAFIQAARYAFGYSGIYDEDEAERGSMIDITPPAASVEDRPSPPRQNLTPYEQGRYARTSGVPFRSVPPHLDTAAARDWERGWQDQDRDTHGEDEKPRDLLGDVVEEPAEVDWQDEHIHDLLDNPLSATEIDDIAEQARTFDADGLIRDMESIEVAIADKRNKL